MDTVSSFLSAREYLVENMEATIETYLTGIWDPHIKFILVRETCNLINNDLKVRFPELDATLYPKVKFRIFEDEMNIECGIQTYINQERNLKFLGTSGIYGVLYDLYYRESYDPRFDYVFIARYGHEPDHYFSGSKSAQAEYYLGQITPLSIAYGMALDNGYLD
jgi:hypothetical protein